MGISTEFLIPPRTRIIDLQPGSRLIVMSDMHRGDGSGADDFAHNSLIFKCALDYYYCEGFTYIELGDAEELWENKAFEQIYITHTSIYDRIARFHDPDPAKTRYIKIWGNHDRHWQDDPGALRHVFPGIRIHEAALLQCPEPDGKRILLWHGHQADPKCSGQGAPVSKFFVRHFWPRLQRYGIQDPTRAAANPGLCNQVDARLYHLATDNDGHVDMIIAGHTHRPVFENLSLTERRAMQARIAPLAGIRRKLKPEPVYYNTGSCVHPRCITGIEITGQKGMPVLELVKWGHDIAPGLDSKNYTLTVKRTLLESTSFDR